MTLATVVLSVVVATDAWECDYSQREWAPSKLEAPCRVLKGARPARIAAARKAWGLTVEQASCAADALVPPADGGVIPEYLRASGNGEVWRRCAERWPEVLVFWVGIIRSHSPSTPFPVESLQRADAGAELAERLLPLDFGPAAALSEVILAKHPERLTELLGSSSVNRDEAVALALPRIERPDGGFTSTEWGALARAGVEGPLRSGRLQFAADTWLSLPESVRAEVRRRPLGEPDDDLRPHLALALALTGAKDDAQRVLVEPSDAGSSRLADVLTRVTRSLLGEVKPDPWELAVEARAGERSLPAEMFSAILPAIAPYQAMVADHVWWVLDHEAEHTDGSALSERYFAAQGRAMKRLEHAAQGLPRRQGSAQSVDAGADVVLVPPPWPYTEAPYRGAPSVAVTPPKFSEFWPLRAERAGQRTVVLAASQRLDPTGEVSMGGYWLLLSEDGTSWQQVYLGFSDHRPFTARRNSRVPLLDASGVVRLEVDQAAIDDKSVMFPPVSTVAPVTRSHVVLTAKLAELTKDSDGDGLSDLVEARLLLDPKAKDTDGDGVLDGDDLTPRLDDRLPATPRAQVDNAFFEYLSPSRIPQALVVAPNSGRTLEAAVGRPAPTHLENVRFAVTDATSLSGLRTLDRVVTLSPAELKAAQALFGTFYPMELEVVLSLDSKHAFIEWNERWRGGTVRADLDEHGTWVITELGSWIT